MSKPDANIGDRLDQAVAWHLRLNATGAEEGAWVEFTAWLESDPANRLAFDRVEAMDTELSRPEVAATLGVDAAALTAPLHPQRAPSRANLAARVSIGAGFAAVALLVALYFFQGAVTTPPSIYVTRVGETKRVVLADGTEIDLNTATRLLVQVDGSARRATLLQGEALFRVAKDAQHPFVVTVGGRTVRVVGTAFDVLRSDGVVTVVVVEGRVAVSSAGSQAYDAMLGPGDRLVAAETGGTVAVERIDSSEALAWRNGYLVYRNAPLAKVVSDLNRYFNTPIVLEDAAVAAQRFTGVLKMDDEMAVLRRIAGFMPVAAARRPDGKIALRASPAKP